MTRVSVVIPCYAQAHYLREAIESVLAQTLADVEVLVVDDGSPDDVAAAVRPYPGVRLLAQANAGVAAARNHGMREARGRMLAFLDADDRLLPDALESATRVLEAHPGVGLVWGFNRPIDPDGTVRDVISNPWPREQAGYEDLLRRNVVGPPAGVVFRREVLEAAGGFRSVAPAAEDYEAYLRVARLAPIRCLGHVVAEYRRHGANMSSDMASMLHSFEEVLALQRPVVAGDARLSHALAEGRRHARRLYDGEPRLEAVRAAVRRGAWLDAARGAAALAVRHPRLFMEALAGSSRRVLSRGR